MSVPEENFYLVRDRETLARLNSGLEIIRSMKHEPISFEGMSEQRLRQATNKNNGSKFAPEWTLQRYVQWLTTLLNQQNWRFPPSQNQRLRMQMDAVVGVAGGQESHTIEVVARGRYVHAYPVEDL